MENCNHLIPRQKQQSNYLLKLAQVVGEFESTDFPPLFAYVPWGHHAEIIAKCKTIEEVGHIIEVNIPDRLVSVSREILQRR